MTEPQEPSATPSTLADLEKLWRWRGVDWPSPDSVKCADELAAALRPSEGPETGRPPADEPPSQIFAAAKMERRVEEAIGDVLSRYSCAEIRDDVTAAVLAALPAGPETGDRERLRAPK